MFELRFTGVKIIGIVGTAKASPINIDAKREAQRIVKDYFEVRRLILMSWECFARVGNWACNKLRSRISVGG
jgi:hypothetical protein